MLKNQLRNELDSARELNAIYFTALSRIDKHLARARAWGPHWSNANRLQLITMLLDRAEDFRILESLGPNGKDTHDSLWPQDPPKTHRRSVPPRPAGRSYLRSGAKPIPPWSLAIRRLWAWLRARN